MDATTFLTNETLWAALVRSVKVARHVEAGVAYFGRGGTRLLPLSRGDRLVVDMSLSTVRAGGTDPHEVEKLIRRGVTVFTRRNLHAKIVVADRWVIAGSANVSKQSRDALDEAGVLTNDRAVARRALEFIERLCTEPVRPQYLRECKRAYKPPRFHPRRAKATTGLGRARYTKLWLVNLSEGFVPDPEIGRYEEGERKAEKLLRAPERSKTESFHWPYKPKMADELEPGDWIIQMMTRKDKSIVVYPPGQLLFVDSYFRGPEKGKERWVFHIEVPKRGQALSWREFRGSAKAIRDGMNLEKPRTMAIRDVQTADGFLALWTPGGRAARR